VRSSGALKRCAQAVRSSGALKRCAQAVRSSGALKRQFCKQMTRLRSPSCAFLPLHFRHFIGARGLTDKASGFYPLDWRFDSFRAHFFFSALATPALVAKYFAHFPVLLISVVGTSVDAPRRHCVRFHKAIPRNRFFAVRLAVKSIAATGVSAQASGNVCNPTHEMEVGPAMFLLEDVFFWKACVGADEISEGGDARCHFLHRVQKHHPRAAPKSKLLLPVQPHRLLRQPPTGRDDF
jgi:hypothetical protein